MKKFLALLLCAIMVITLFPTAALAAPGSTYTYGDLTLTELGDGTLSVTEYTGTGGPVTIPHIYDPDPGITGDEKEVTAIGESVFNGKAITSVVIEEGIKTIGASAFCDCDLLQSVTLPEGVTTIGQFAFYECNALETVYIPGTVTSMGQSIFILCSNLKNVTLGNGISAIGSTMFNGCFSLETIKIPDTVETIGQSAFSSTALKTLSLPEGVTTIESFAFADCDKLESIIIPESVVTVGERAFVDSAILKKATVLGTDTGFGTFVFYKTSINSDGIYGFGLSTAQAYASGNSHPFHTLYKVMYDSKGGSNVPYGYAVSGGTVSAPDDPTREGFIFRGWYEDEAYNTPASFPYTVSGNATLYAKWAGTDGTGTLQISSSPAGADVYIDGEFTDSVTPCELELPAGTHKVELKIPGYETYVDENVQIFSDETASLGSIVQLTELTETDVDHTITVTTLQDKVRWSSVSGMNSITVAQLKADTGTAISLREAIQAVKNEPAGSGHYRIEFAPSLKGGTISLFKPGDGKFPVEDGMLQNLYIEKRGNMTINGDIDRDGEADITLEPYTNGSPSSPKGSVLNVYAADVTLAGLIFKGDEALSYSTLIFRVPDRNTEKYDVDNVRILGCTLDHSQGTGVATCGAYGYGGTSYGGAGTTNFTDLVFSGNTFIKTPLFSFAGAGDEDYNLIDGYYICANRFYNGCIGMLAADAHTWYVYGSNDPNGNGGVAGQVGFCEHNQLKNIYVTGNYFENTENAGIVGATTANQGNSNNLIENMYIRNNTSIVADGIEGGVSLENASIGRDDRYTSDELSHNTANNIMRNVYLENNDFEIGDKSRFGVYNIQGGCVRDSYMDGTGNLIENIQIKDNRIECDFGAYIRNLGGECGTINNDVSDNTMRNIVFSGNALTGVDTDWMTSGIEVTNHNNVMNTHIPSYHDNEMSDITIEDNTVSGYYKGITVAGSLGNGVNAHSIEDVTVSGNTVTCKADGEFGIIAAGCSVDAYGGDAYNGSTNCEAKDITISGNNITAPGGILLAGTYVNAPVKGSLEGNKINSVSVYNNTITRPEGSNINRPVPGITAADIIAPWPRIEADTMLDNNSCGQPDIHGNTVNGFISEVLDMSELVSSYPTGSPITAEAILSENKAKTEAVFGGNSMDWNWYGASFSSSLAGSFTAAARRIGQIGFDYLYQCVNTTDEYYVRFDIGSGTRTGGGVLVQSVKGGEDAAEPNITPPEGYSFDGWDRAFTNVTGPLTVSAVYTSLENTPVESVTLSRHSSTITVGDTITLSASVLPQDATNPTVTWESGKPSVATVDTSGKVTAVSAGNATITATADGISDTCEVTVKPVTYNISVSSNNASYGSVTGGGTYSKGASVTLTAITKPGYRFIRWTEGGVEVSKNITYAFTAASNRSLVAEFGNADIPTSVTAVCSGYNSIRVSWNGVQGANGYELERSTSPAGGFKLIKSTTSLYYTNTGLATNTKYYYRVRSYSTVGRSKIYGPYSAVVSGTPILAKVTGITAAASSATGNKISWGAVSGRTGYEILRSTSSTGGFVSVGTTTRTYYNDSNLTPNTTYYYKVRSYRTISRVKQYGLESDTASARPVFATVTGATASMYNVTSNKVIWNTVSGRKGYEIYRSESPDNGFAYIGYTTKTYYTDKNLVPNKTYYYCVRAYVMTGRTKYFSGYSNTASAVPVFGSVTGPAITPYSSSKNKISWNAVSGRSGYEVLRSTSLNGIYTAIGTTTRTYYYDKNPAPGTYYYYKIRAYVTVNRVKVYSGESAVVSAAP